jgi:PAS domain S-box-containing protein
MLALAESHLRQLVESSPDIVIAVDRSGTIIFYNDGARENLGYAPDEIIGQKVTMVYPSLEAARAVMQAMRDAGNAGRISDFETTFRRKDGQLIPVVISGSLIYDRDGGVLGSIGFARDISRMRRQEQLATACDIAVSLAHEINNPLETITNSLEMLGRALGRRLTAAAKQSETRRLERARAALERVRAIVERLDEVSRKGVYQTRGYLGDRRMADLAPPPSCALPPGPAEAAAPLAVLRNDANAPAAAEPARPTRALAKRLSRMTALVVDDDVAVLDSLAELLRAEGLTVHATPRASQALALLRSVAVDVVISDVVMPEMDGYEFYLRVRQEFPCLPIVLMTGYHYDRDHIIKRCRMQGLEGAIFKKPINPDKMRELLSRISEKSHPQAARRSA